MTSVVLGGNGFLGAAVAEELIRRDGHVIVFDLAGSQEECDRRLGDGAARFVRGDILDLAALREVFSEATEVFHFAGQLGTSELDDQPAFATKVNILGSISVFETAVACRVARVFHASKPNVWNNAYTITKHAAERFGELFGRSQDHTKFCTLRYFNAYGPHQALGPVRKLVPTFIAQALQSKPLEVYGDGHQIVDLIYVDDLARASVAYAALARGPAAVDCGRGVPVSVNQVAEAVNGLVGNTAGIRHLPMRRGEVEATVLVADTGPLIDAIGTLRLSDWKESLLRTIDWYATYVATRPHGRALIHALA